jgi:hypothetical protein
VSETGYLPADAVAVVTAGIVIIDGTVGLVTKRL